MSSIVVAIVIPSNSLIMSNTTRSVGSSANDRAMRIQRVTPSRRARGGSFAVVTAVIAEGSGGTVAVVEHTGPGEPLNLIRSGAGEEAPQNRRQEKRDQPREGNDQKG